MGGEGDGIYTGSWEYSCFRAGLRCKGHIFSKLDLSHSVVQNNPLFNLSGLLKAWI